MLRHHRDDANVSTTTTATITATIILLSKLSSIQSSSAATVSLQSTVAADRLAGRSDQWASDALESTTTAAAAAAILLPRGEVAVDRGSF